MMASVIDRNGAEIKLRDCDCGSEPEYWSASGLSHVIKCSVCGQGTPRQMCGIDAIAAWNNATLNKER